MRSLHGRNTQTALVCALIAITIAATIATLLWEADRNADVAARVEQQPSMFEMKQEERQSPLELARAQSQALPVRFIGDSLSDGWNASEQPKGFRPLVAERLSQDGPIAETAVYRAGATTSEVSAMTTPPPDGPRGVLIVELGTNDVSKNDAVTFHRQYKELLDAQDAGNSILVCVGPYQEGSTDGLDRVIEKLCREYGGTYVAIGELRSREALVAQPGTPAFPAAADGAHPNDAGHLAIANEISRVLGLRRS